MQLLQSQGIQVDQHRLARSSGDYGSQVDAIDQRIDGKNLTIIEGASG